jgi:hypothetical protein
VYRVLAFAWQLRSLSQQRAGNLSTDEKGKAMKATAIALVMVSAYWVGQSLTVIREDMTKGVVLLTLGLLLLPLAKYAWSRNISGGPGAG